MERKIFIEITEEEYNKIKNGALENESIYSNEEKLAKIPVSDIVNYLVKSFPSDIGSRFDIASQMRVETQHGKIYINDSKTTFEYTLTTKSF